MVTKNIIVSVPSPQVLFLLDVISYTIDLTSYLSLHCYGYVSGDKLVICSLS